jgi:serine protease inhibitor
VMILINAIYFKGIWAKTFDSNLTQSQPFFLLNGQAKQVPLMSREGDYWYWENELLQLVSLPYDDQDLALDIFLPKKNIDFTSFLGQFNLENWQRWSSQVGKRKGVVKIPRFKLEYQNTLNDVLNKLGMSSAFNANQADFSGLTNTKVYVSEVLHKTYLEVNEEGSEAAAVTSIGIKAMAMPASQEPFVLRADRPFVCILREKQTNSLIFIASIVEPG